jgi:hypothetical protein
MSFTPTAFSRGTLITSSFLNSLQAAMQTAITNVNANGSIKEFSDPGLTTHLYIDELFDQDINYYLTRAEIADTRNPTGPTIDLTAKIQAAINYLVAKYTSDPNPSSKAAGQSIVLRFHGSYLVTSLRVPPSVTILGDNFRETIFVQKAGATDHLIRGLARYGKTKGSRSSYANFRNFSIQMNPAVFGPVALDGSSLTPYPLCGIFLEPGTADPSYFGGAYNAALIEYVTIVGASGNGFFCPNSRHAPKLRFCYISGCGTTQASDGSYADNIYIASSSDAELLHCGSGSGGGNSLRIHNCETPQVKGGDWWASNNAALGYRAHLWEGMNYGIIEGADINGAFEYQGPNGTKVSCIRIIGNNFRFRDSSFGDDDPGVPGVQPAPLDAYIILNKSINSVSLGNSFTPYYDSGGTVAARPSYIYEILGTSVHYANDQIPDLTSNDWPCGANIAAGNHYADMTNDWTKIVFQARATDSVTGLHRTLFNYIGFIPGQAGGIAGTIDGTSKGVGIIGEYVNAKLGSGAAVSLTTTVAANIASLALTPGDWDISGCVQFASAAPATGGLCEIGISTISATISSTTASTYNGNALSYTTVTGAIKRLDIVPTRISISATTTHYLVAKGTFSTANVGAYGIIQARRVA